MNTIKQLSRNTVTSLLIFLQVCAFPFVAYADDTPATQTDPVATTPSAQPAESIETPTPVAQPKPDPYLLNPETGNYENSKYSWSPSTFQTTPKTEKPYSYSSDKEVWETPEYAYDSANQEYRPNIPLPVAKLAKTTEPMSKNPFSAVLPSADLDYNSQGTGSSANHFFDGFYNAKISNNIYSSAQSGNALVAQNTLAGNALSGNATAMANLLNILQTSFSPGSSGAVGTFIANIDGDVVGDITIDPSALPTDPLAVDNASTNPGLAIKVENNGTITNNLSLAATSGDAAVTKNTQAGNATTGNATAIANVVNMINSSVAAGQSFFGIVNINGNFNGDILMPPNALDYLLASSAPRTTVDLANLTNNQTITNNIQAAAESGKATVANNTQAGSATTGKASTEVTILNLTSSNIIGQNALLVFVNVMGEWVGLVVDAPAGSTSAAYAGGVTSNQRLPGSGDTIFNATNNAVITNNIVATAASGDAEVSSNTIGGDATSGDAKASVNLANVMNSNLALSDWFGVLFINVFGSWHGSFGVDTAAGNQSKKPTKQSTKYPQLVRFTPKTQSSISASPLQGSQNNIGLAVAVTAADFYGDQEITQGTGQAVLASANTSNTPPQSATASTSKSSLISWQTIFASVLIVLLAVSTERLITSRRQAELAKASIPPVKLNVQP